MRDMLERDCRFLHRGKGYASEPKGARKSGSLRRRVGFVSPAVRQRNRRALRNGPVDHSAGRLLAERANRFSRTGDSRESQEDFFDHEDFSMLGNGAGAQSQRDPIHAPLSEWESGPAILKERAPGNREKLPDTFCLAGALGKEAAAPSREARPFSESGRIPKPAPGSLFGVRN